MLTQRRAAAILDTDFLTIRHALLSIAASLDRIDRGGAPAPAADARLEKIRGAIVALTDGQPRRAERIQMIFSRPYESKRRA